MVNHSAASSLDADIQMVLDQLKKQSPEDLLAAGEGLACGNVRLMPEHVQGLLIMLLHRLGSQVGESP